MVIKKKKTETAVPLMAGSTTVARIPMAGCPHPVESRYSINNPVIETQKLVVQRYIMQQHGIEMRVVPTQMYAFVM